MSPWRRRVVKGLVILGSLLAFLSVFAIWTERQALNTNDWVHTSGSLIRNPTIRHAIGEYLVEQLYENVNVEKELEEILPGEVKELAGPAAGGLRQVAGTGAEKVLETGTAQSLWEDANRTAHEQLLAVLENKKEAVETANGEVKLNLGSLLTNLAGQVGLAKNLAEKLPPDAGQIRILKSEQLKTAQDIVIAIKGLALIFSILTFLVFGLAIYLTRGGRWVTVLFSGIGLIAAGVLVIIARHVAGGIVVDQLVKQQNIKPAAEAAWGIGTSLMVSIATTIIVVGVLFAAAGWLSSPTGSARAVRRVIAPALRDWMPWVYTGLGIIVAIYLLSAPGVGLRTFLTVLVVAGMAAFGIHELGKQTAEEFPDARFNDTFGGPRDKLVAAVKGANLGERASKIRLPEVKRPDVRLPDVRRPGGGGGQGGGAEAGGSAGAGAPPPAAEAPTQVIDDEDALLHRLERLGDLRDRGILTDEEFAAEKARLLDRPPS
jgi:hypothetical protein